VEAETDVIGRKQKINHTAFKNVKLLSPTSNFGVFNCNHFHISSEHRCNAGSGKERQLQLMDIPTIIKPQHPMTVLRNFAFSLLIKGYYDNEYSPITFLDAATQAVIGVSKIISKGDFNSLDGLLTKQAISEIRQNYNKLNDTQRQMIALKPEDIFYKIIYEIRMIFNDETNQRFVEIMVILHGVQDYHKWKTPSEGMFDSTEQKQQHAEDFSSRSYICNYRFRREFTKGVDDQWTINQANHRMVNDVVKDSEPWQR